MKLGHAIFIAITLLSAPICLETSFGNPTFGQLDHVLVQKLGSQAPSLIVSFVLNQPIPSNRARFLLDVDGPSAGEGATGADFMLEGETWYSYSGTGGEWSWSPISKAEVVSDGNTLRFLIEEAPSFKQARWLAQITTESWEISDRYPESGMKEATWDALPVLQASELNASLSETSQNTPNGNRIFDSRAEKPKPVDLSELLVHLPSYLSPRLDAETAGKTWDAIPPGKDAPPSWTPQGSTTPLPLAFTMKDVVTGEEVDLTPERTYKTDSGLRWSGKALGVRWDIFGALDDQDDLQLTGRFKAENDRCLRIGAGCSMNLIDWTWHDDFHLRRTIEETVDPYRNTGPFFFGSAGEQSLYPFGVISMDNQALIVETDPYEPRVCQIYAETEKDFFGIYYDLGLTQETKRFPGMASFRCTFRSMAQGGPASFRRALSAFYARFPAYKKSRTGKAGLWMPFSDISKIPDAEDFGFAFFEKGTAAVRDTDLIRKLGVLSLPYTEPWLHWLSLTEEAGWTYESALKQMELLANNDDAQANRFSAASLLGAVRKPDGTILMTFRHTPWSNGARMEVSTDPELPTTEAYPVNRAMAEWAFIRKAITEGEAEGIYLDSMSAMEVLNYDRRAMAVTDIPCTFDTQTLKPGLAAPLANIKFTAALSAYLHQEGRYLMANFPCWNHPFFMPYIDIPGEETTWYADGKYRPMATRQLNFRRAISGHKPFGFLQSAHFDDFKDEAMRRYFKECLFYGFQPSFFSYDGANAPYWENPAWLERDRHFFRTYMPFIQRLGKTGWEPEGPVTVDAESVWGEHFGRPENGAFFLTLRNESAVLKTTGLTVNGLGKRWICYDPFSGRVERLLPNAAGISKISFALPEQDVGLLVFVRTDRLTDEIEFLEEWKADHDPASLNIGNLQSLERELKANILCREIHSATSVSGHPNQLSVHITNQGTIPVVIGDLESNAALSASRQTIPPGETALLEGTYGSGDVDAQSRMAFSCRCSVGEEQITLARSWKPLFTKSVEVVAGPSVISTLQRHAVIDLELHNQVNQPVPFRIKWVCGKKRGRHSGQLGSLESQTESLVVPAAFAGANPVHVSVFSGKEPVFKEAFAVTRLPRGSSLARDSRVRVAVDSTFPGYNLEPLTDGVADVEGLEWNHAAWASEESPLPHWVRISFPEPTSVSSVVIHWNAENNTANASQRGEIRGILKSGESVVLASYTNANAEPETEITFRSVDVVVLELYQPGGAGSGARPNLLWLREIEIH